MEDRLALQIKTRASPDPTRGICHLGHSHHSVVRNGWATYTEVKLQGGPRRNSTFELQGFEMWKGEGYRGVYLGGSGFSLRSV
jgi:hypothetical protein